MMRQQRHDALEQCDLTDCSLWDAILYIIHTHLLDRHLRACCIVLREVYAAVGPTSKLFKSSVMTGPIARFLCAFSWA